MCMHFLHKISLQELLQEPHKISAAIITNKWTAKPDGNLKCESLYAVHLDMEKFKV